MRRAWILRQVLEQIQYEAESKAPLETGGLLVGYCSADNSQVVVTGMVGPGPRAKHRKWTYKPDYSFHREEIRNIFYENDGVITYLGDWHSHPENSSHLSFLDKRALRNIACFQGNYISCPVMLVLGGINNQKLAEWTPCIWGISRQPSNFPWAKWQYIPLEVTIFDHVP